MPLAKKAKKVVAIDFSEEMMNIAKNKTRKLKNVEFKKVNVTKKLPFKDNSFDKVLCALVVNHINNLEKFLKEVNRVLKKGGIIVYDDFAADIDRKAKLKFEDILRNMSDDGFEIFSVHPIDKHIHTIHRANFEIVELKPLRIDQKIRHTIDKQSYNRFKGRTLAMVYKAKKS